MSDMIIIIVNLRVKWLLLLWTFEHFLRIFRFAWVWKSRNFLQAYSTWSKESENQNINFGKL